MAQISELIDKTLASVKATHDMIIFETVSGEKFRMYHSQDCCEHVEIESIVGDLQDLVGTPILLAEERVSCGITPEDVPTTAYEPESFTWTFYTIATVKGYVDIRWYGSSNGYYSESVDFVAEEYYQ